MRRRSWGSTLVVGLGLAAAIVIVLGGAALLGGLWYISTRNALIAKRETVRGAWGQVENVYQRRADLVPNLVETVKGYAAHESAVLIAVTEARTKASQIRVDPSDPATLRSFQAAQSELSSALSRLLVTVEKYPDLKADGLFRDLMTQLEGAENRITVERKRWNDAVLDFNTSIQMFPTTWVARRLGMTPLAYLEAEEGAEKAPRVSF